MSAHRATHPVATRWRVPEVSAGGSCAWRTRPASRRPQADAASTATIRAIHARSHGTYGAPRVHAERAAEGVHVGRQRVARLMAAAGVAGVSRRTGTTTTRRTPDARPAPDLVERDFTPPGPDRLRLADITCLPTWAGFLYLAVVLDAWSRHVVGWAMATPVRQTRRARPHPGLSSARPRYGMVQACRPLRRSRLPGASRPSMCA